MTDIVERWPHRRIYLEPRDCADPSTGPMWAQDDVGSEDESGASVAWEPYVKETELTTLRAEIEQLRVALEPFATALKGNWSRQSGSMKILAGPQAADLRIELTLYDFRLAALTTQEKQND